MQLSLLTKRQKVLFEITIYSALFVLSFLFPICNYYYLAEDESMIVKPQYFNNIKIVYVFLAYFLMVVFAFFSASKILLRVINILAIVLVILVFLYIQLSFVWWGASPYHPDLAAGYWLSHLFLLLLVIRTFAWSGKFAEIGFHRKMKIPFGALSILMLALIVYWVLRVLF